MESSEPEESGQITFEDYFLSLIDEKSQEEQKNFTKQIHFGHFPSLSFEPSQGHNSVNIGSNSTSRTVFEN